MTTVMTTIIKMYVTMMPVILAGVFNMLFVKTSLYKRHKSPIDHGKCLADGKRLFGDNKTWTGFFGMIFCGLFSQCLWGLVCKYWLSELNYFYQYHQNTIVFNIVIGASLGLTYVLFELPNSWLKRRLEIPAGKTVTGLKGGVFFIIDQIDSLIGVALVFALLYPMPLWQYFLYLFLGAFTHIFVNAVLYGLKIRKNL